jgi:hypothetical protein
MTTTARFDRPSPTTRLADQRRVRQSIAWTDPGAVRPAAWAFTTR